MFHRIEHVLRRGTGLAVPGAEVTVKVTGTSSKPTIYATNDTSQPISNPVITDENGRYSYYVANGVYDEVVTHGSVTETEAGIQMYDASTIVAGAGTWGSIGGSIGDQADLASALGTKATTSALAAIALTGSASDLASGTIPAGRLPVFDNATKGAVPNSGGGTVNFLRADGTWSAPPGSGAGGSLTGSGYTMSTARFLGRTTAATGAIEELTPASAKTLLAIGAADVSGLANIATSGSGADLSSASVVLAKVAVQAAGTILGNNTGGAASPSALTAAQVKVVLGITTGDVAPPAVTTQAGTAYTAVLADAGTYIRFTNAAAITFTIPPNSAVAFPIGTVIEFEQAAGGIVTVTPGAAVTINSRGGVFGTAGQFAPGMLRKTAADAWTLTGDIA